MLKRFVACRTGATAVEYGLILGVLSLAIMGAAQPLSNALQLMWGDNATKIDQVGK